MGKYNIGEVWWVRFPYNDQDKEKHRPAIVIDDDTIAILAMYVTSRDKDNPYSIEIEDWKEVGLSKPSWTRIDRIVSISEWHMDRKIGDLSQRDLAKITQLVTEITRESFHEFSLIAIMDSEGKYLQKYDERWKCWLFPYLRSVDNNKENVDNFVSQLFHSEVITEYICTAKHCKYSVNDEVYKIYNHKLYRVLMDEASENISKSILDNSEFKYQWMSIEEMEEDMAGLDWDVTQKDVFTQDGIRVAGYKANVREQDGKILGVVTNRYKVVQNRDAFAFTDELLEDGVKYETAGSLQGGRKIWILAKLPDKYIIQGEQIMPYLVFSNTHDGSGAIKVAMTPIRVVCNNTLNLALNSAKRVWSANHTGDIGAKMEDAKKTLFMAEEYMSELGKEFSTLSRKKVSDPAVEEYIDLLLPIADNASETTERNMLKLRQDMKQRYHYAPDLRNIGKNAYRFINAVSDFATHAKPLRETKNYKENLFLKTMEGNALIDRAYKMVMAA